MCASTAGGRKPCQRGDCFVTPTYLLQSGKKPIGHLLIGRRLPAAKLMADASRQIPHCLAVIVDAGVTHLDKSQCGMEGVRFRVRRTRVDFTDDAFMSCPRCMFEQI